MTDRYAVIGNPIAHSKSPRIHTLFAEQTGEQLNYRALLSPLESFCETVFDFREEKGKGVNVTVPFKQQAWEIADSHTPYALRAQAVNTLVFKEDGTVTGANTDGVGIVRDLMENHDIGLKDKRILILGAGGAVRGILLPLLEKHPHSIFIANRTASKAEQLALDFSDYGCIQGGGFKAIPKSLFDLVINGTAASLQGEVPPISPQCLAQNACCYDMMYAAQPTPFVAWGQQHGAAQSLDGLGMLVEQAAESFALWRGVRPETRSVLTQLRKEISTE